MRENKDRTKEPPAQEHLPSQVDDTHPPTSQPLNQPATQPTIYQSFQKSKNSPKGWKNRKWVILISLFDGTHTAREALKEQLGTLPDMIILCEVDPSERSLVAQKYRYDETSHGIVINTRDDVLALYATDVWSLLKGEGTLLRMACEHIPVDKREEVLVVIINGSLCEDLTSVSNLGTAGFAGT
eukprot:11584686-Heterocapsa_arctica.AAC.1